MLICSTTFTHLANRNPRGFVCFQNQVSQQYFRISHVLFVMSEKLPKETISTSRVFSFSIFTFSCYDGHKERIWGWSNLSRMIFESSFLLQFNIIESQYFKTEENCLYCFERFSVLTPTLVQTLNLWQIMSIVTSSLPLGSFGTEGYWVESSGL